MYEQLTESALGQTTDYIHSLYDTAHTFNTYTTVYDVLGIQYTIVHLSLLQTKLYVLPTPLLNGVQLFQCINMLAIHRLN